MSIITVCIGGARRSRLRRDGQRVLLLLLLLLLALLVAVMVLLLVLAVAVAVVVVVLCGTPPEPRDGW